MCATVTDMFFLFFKLSYIQGYLFKEVLPVYMYGMLSPVEKKGRVTAPPVRWMDRPSTSLVQQP